LPLRVLIDEHISPTVALRLQQLGFYAVASVRDRNLIGKQDWELIAWCIRNQHAMFTNNEKDWEQLHKQCVDRGEQHCGILLVGDWTTDEYYWCLRQYLELSADPPPTNRLIPIQKASPDFIKSRSAP
jgi:predicted nuclease of predicted toxin-antitoxin system